MKVKEEFPKSEDGYELYYGCPIWYVNGDTYHGTLYRPYYNRYVIFLHKHNAIAYIKSKQKS